VTATDILRQLTAHGIAVRRLCADSRRIAPGDIFVAMPGKRSNGRDYVVDALARGAVAILHEGPLPAPGVPAIDVPGLAGLAGEICHLAYGRPTERLWLAGVTGTNGKTSISQWLAQTMTAAGRSCAVVGTLGCGFPGRLAAGVNTTPDAVSVQTALADFVDAGARACAMEVSSIGIEEGRINGCRFATAIFTNLTQDHLDYHGTMAAYGEAKRRLFDWPGLQAAVINLDDPFGAELADSLGSRLQVIGYTLTDRRGGTRTLAARNLAMTAAGIDFEIDGTAFHLPAVGRFNAANGLAVIGALITAGFTLDDSAALIAQLTPPPGRMEIVARPGQPLVVVDYAHTPDALEKALTALRETATARGGRLVCLFGCGGDRDRSKRPLMGGIAERLADAVVVSSDNPRFEAPDAIIADILAGMTVPAIVEADRAAAIRRTLATADAGDVILLAGKGHETYQEVAGRRLPFSDIDQARDALEARP
jgi:UDP-N-acetylmuramoyl-L-alanyl-D-glutamate--2,6-diaminopimelate ligase